MSLKDSPLGGLPRLRGVRSVRYSTWDRSGGNDDRVHLAPGARALLAEIDGPGCINHLWVTLDSREPAFLRKVVLRMYWDGEGEPSVEVPIGDFFGAMNDRVASFSALPIQMSPQDGRSFNCWFPMPFEHGARVEVTSDCEQDEVLLYAYVDAERWEQPEPGLGRFHAQWRRQDPCDGIPEAGLSNAELQVGGANLDGAGNYVLLEAEGHGHYVGCFLGIHNLRRTDEWNWYGEGDDMIFVDGEPFPPSLHGTGTEDYFGTAWCPTQAYSAPYHGIILPGEANWAGTSILYRFHVEDPVVFRRSIRVTIEHGHANRRSDDYCSTAFWYQAEPHRPFPSLPPVAARLPRRD